LTGKTEEDNPREDKNEGGILKSIETFFTGEDKQREGKENEKMMEANRQEKQQQRAENKETKFTNVPFN
jgi:hypothetical protein